MNTITGPNTKAYRLAMQITEDIQNGKFASGVLLPPDGELANDYDVSRITLRKSLAILSQKGRLQRLPQGGALAIPSAPPPETSGSGSESSSLPARTNKRLAMGMVIASGSSYAVIHRFNGGQTVCRRKQPENDPFPAVEPRRSVGHSVTGRGV